MRGAVRRMEEEEEELSLAKSGSGRYARSIVR